MSETYCGKDCNSCKYAVELECTGCFNGPGREWYGDCDIANCCRSQCFVNCMECDKHERCLTYEEAERKPYMRTRKTQVRENPYQREKKITITSNAGTKVMILFFVFIFQFIFNILSEEALLGSYEGLMTFTSIVAFILPLVYGLIVMTLSSVNKKFITAGICYFLTPIIGMLAIESFDETIVLICALIEVILSIISTRQEIYAFSESLKDVNKGLSRKWLDLWASMLKWIGIMIASVFISLLIYVVGAILLIVTAIVIFILSIKRLVYMIETVRVYNNYKYMD